MKLMEGLFRSPVPPIIGYMPEDWAGADMRIQVSTVLHNDFKKFNRKEFSNAH